MSIGKPNFFEPLIAPGSRNPAGLEKPCRITENRTDGNIGREGQEK